MVFRCPGDRPPRARRLPAVEIGSGLGLVLEKCTVRVLSAGREELNVATDPTDAFRACCWTQVDFGGEV